MGKGIFALEENQEVDVSAGAESVEASLLEVTDAQADIDETTEQIQQAETVEDTLTEMDAAATPEEAVEIATEALLQLVGYKSKSKFSLEEFSTRLDTNVSIAQEGMIDKMVTAIKAELSSNDKLITIGDSALQELKTKGKTEKTEVRAEFNEPDALVNEFSDALISSDVKKLFTSAEKFAVLSAPMYKWFKTNQDSGNDKKGTYEGQTEELIRVAADLEVAATKNIRANASHIAQIKKLRTEAQIAPVDYATAKKNIDAIRKIKSSVASDVKSLMESFKKVDSNDNSFRLGPTYWVSMTALYAFVFGPVGVILALVFKAIAHDADAGSKTKMAFTLLKKNISELKAINAQLSRFELHYINYIKASTN